MSQHVTLTWFEHQIAYFCGTMRGIESARLGYRPVVWNGDPKQNDHQSAAAELAVAKYINRFWRMGVNTFKEPDVGASIEVRWTPEPAGCLVVRPHDHDDRPYVLVRGLAPDFEIVGYVRGVEAKREEWRCDPGGRGVCYMVPSAALRELKERNDQTI